MDENTRTDYIERTLVILKPDAVQRGIVGEILQRFERVGLKIVGMKWSAQIRNYLSNIMKVSVS